MGIRVVIALLARHHAYIDLAASQMERQIGEDLARRGMVGEKEAVHEYDLPRRGSGRCRRFDLRPLPLFVPTRRLSRCLGREFPGSSGFPGERWPEHYRDPTTGAWSASSRVGLAAVANREEAACLNHRSLRRASRACKNSACASAFSDRRSPLSKVTTVIAMMRRSTHNEALRMYQMSSASFSVGDRLVPPFT